MKDSWMPRNAEAQFIARYSKSSVRRTSTMKSPPLEVWLTGSLVGGSVSTAICFGPGTAALRFGLGAETCAVAAAGVSAAAPTRPAPLRKLRRSELGKLRRLDIYSSHRLRLMRGTWAQGRKRSLA